MIKLAPTKWEGLEGLDEAELKRLRAPAERAVRKAARHFANEVKKTLTGARTGRIYRTGRRGKTYQASAPGEPPASPTGMLRKSITSTDPVWDGWNVSSEAGSNRPQARRLEWGGVDRRGVRILPRPYFEPTYLRERDKIDHILEESVA